MKAMIAESTVSALNNLLQACFDKNAEADNYAYNLEYKNLMHAGQMYHHYIAHLFPKIADTISDLMVKLNARPVRYVIGSYEQELTVAEIFQASVNMIEDFRAKVYSAMSIAELNTDIEVVCELQDLLEDLVPYRKQIYAWSDYVSAYSDMIQFDLDFKDLTTFITSEDD